MKTLFLVKKLQSVALDNAYINHAKKVRLCIAIVYDTDVVHTT